MIELALCLPLFLMTLYGIWGITGLLKAKYQMLLIHHAVMREAAGGIANPQALSILAEGYARSMGVKGLEELRVSVKSVRLPQSYNPVSSLIASLARGSRVRVAARMPVVGPMARIWPDGITMECSSVCLIGTWKNPLSKLIELIALVFQ